MATSKKAAAPAARSAKTAAKRASKLPPPPVARKPAPPKPAARPAPTEAPKGDKPEKDKKPKLVRDSFTIPKPEYAVLEALKERAARLGRPTKKSELLRAGIKALAAMADGDFLASVGAVPAVKTGRPAKS